MSDELMTAEQVRAEVAPVVARAGGIVIATAGDYTGAADFLKAVKAAQKRVTDFFGPMKAAALFTPNMPPPNCMGAAACCAGGACCGRDRNRNSIVCDAGRPGGMISCVTSGTRPGFAGHAIVPGRRISRVGLVTLLSPW